MDNAPGAPVHVLLTDEIAEHVPGCNLAIRRHCLEAIGGFDPRFHAAGDDVDVCWRLQHQGWTLGFSHGAMVWHHRRRRIQSYWQQQVGYGRAESLLAAKWPDKYAPGRGLRFSGRFYGNGVAHALFRMQHVYYGFGGFAPFQAIYEPAPGIWGWLPLMPAWYVMLLALAGCSLLGLLWPPMYLSLIPVVLGVALSLSHAVGTSLAAEFATPPRSRWQSLWLRVLTAWLCLLQPAARLWGRHGFDRFGRQARCKAHFRWPRPQTMAWWTPVWMAPEHRYQAFNRALCGRGAVVRQGSALVRWDFEVEGGRFGGARLLLGIEHHGAGAQYIRLRIWPRWRPISRSLVLLTIPLLLAAIASHNLVAVAVGAVGLMLIALMTLVQSGKAVGLVIEVFAAYTAETTPSTMRGTHAEPGDSASESASS